MLINLIRLMMLSCLCYFFSSCSSSNSTTNSSKEDELELVPVKLSGEKDVSNENSIKPIEKIAYKKNDDFYQKSPSDKLLIETESLGRIFANQKNEKIEFEGDVLATIAKSCYQKNYVEFEQQVQKNAPRFINHPGFWNQVGSCYVQQGQYRKALLFFNKSLDLYPNYIPALNNIGYLYFKKGDDGKSFVAINKAINVSLTTKTPRYNKAFLLLRYGQIYLSRKLFLEFYQLYPTDNDVLHGLAITYLMEKNHSRALEYYNRMDFKKESMVPSLAINYAYCLALNNQKSKAQSILSAIEKAPLGVWDEYHHYIKNLINLHNGGKA